MKDRDKKIFSMMTWFVLRPCELNRSTPICHLFVLPSFVRAVLRSLPVVMIRE